MIEDKGSQLRRDAHHGGWVLLTRQPSREQLLAIPRDAWPADTPNVLAEPEKMGAHIVWTVNSKLPDGDNHIVRVIANHAALYRVEGQEDREGLGMYDQMRGVGAHEIIIESPKPTDTITTLSPYQFALSLHAFQERIRDLKRDMRLHSFSIFREWQCGEDPVKIHPHSQLIASAIVPLNLQNELQEAREHYEYKERCLFCDMIRQEIQDEKRVVMLNDDYIAYCPFASRYPFEIHLFSRHHTCDFSEETEIRLPELAAAIRDIALRLEKSIPRWRVLMVLHTAPVHYRRRQQHLSVSSAYHWHFEFLPQPPGFIDWYARTGTHIECTAPENAAQFLRELDIPSHWV